MRSLSISPQGPQLDQPQPELPKQDLPKQEALKQELPTAGLQPNTMQRTLSQDTQTIALDLQREPGVKRPISDNPEHPVNSKDASVYYSRTGNIAGLDPERQAEKLADTMRSLGPGKVLLLETAGPAGGSYVEELRKSLPKALEMVPPEQRPEIRFFISDGRPVMPPAGDPKAPPDPNGPKQGPNAFGDYLKALEKEKPGSGYVDIDKSIPGTDRGIPNWGNPKVVDYFMKERIEPAIALAKELGVKSVVLDDHIGVPPDNPKKGIETMTNFKEKNGLATDSSSDRQVQNIITDIYRQGLQKINDAGLDAGLSSAADPKGSLRFGINMNKLASLTDTIEIQGYRTQASSVMGMTDNLLQNVRGNFDQYKDVKEIKVALVTKASGVELSEKELIRQQDVIDVFRSQINAEYKKHGLEPPKVSTSLWAHQNFYKDQ